MSDNDDDQWFTVDPRIAITPRGRPIKIHLNQVGGRMYREPAWFDVLWRFRYPIVLIVVVGIGLAIGWLTAPFGWVCIDPTRC